MYCCNAQYLLILTVLLRCPMAHKHLVVWIYFSSMLDMSVDSVILNDIPHRKGSGIWLFELCIMTKTNMRYINSHDFHLQHMQFVQSSTLKTTVIKREWYKIPHMSLLGVDPDDAIVCYCWREVSQIHHLGIVEYKNTQATLTSICIKCPEVYH